MLHRLTILPICYRQPSSFIFTSNFKATARLPHSSFVRLVNSRLNARPSATMSTQSKACCTVPPVVAEGYKAKGD